MILNDAHVRYTAAEYNRYTQDFVKPYDEMLLRWIRKQARTLPADFTLVDIGTGTAQFLIQLAMLTEFSSCNLVGTDLFEDMIVEARTASEAVNIASRLTLLLDDIHSSTLASASADLMISRSTLHHWSDPSAGLKEMYRILRPGGRALIIDVRRDAPAEAIAEFNRLRAEAGIGPSILEEKFTTAEVEQFLRQAEIADFATVTPGTEGLNALGLAVLMTKPA